MLQLARAYVCCLADRLHHGGNIDAVHSSLARVSAYARETENGCSSTSQLEGQLLATFIGDRWSEKIKEAFNLGTTPTRADHYNRLHDIAETYRNMYAHGGLDKEGAAVWVHLPDLGAIPARP
jgi:hypothetical protein